jgi:DNA transposition AAA+ family ATPase
MTLEEQRNISNDLRTYCDRFTSHNVAARTLKVSAATVSAIVNGKFESISDEMFLVLARQININSKGWQIQETTAFKEIYQVLSDAQEYQNVSWIVGDAGCGKTTAIRAYTDDHREVYHILCSEDMNKRAFVREMAEKIGVSHDKSSAREVLKSVISALNKQKRPLLIFDEGDKLRDDLLAYFITIYNHLEDKVGIVFASTDYIERRMSMGLSYNKRGYKEINSRIGRNFYNLERTTKEDVYAICRANGIHAKADLREILREVSGCDFDLRRLKKVIHKTRRIHEIESSRSQQDEQIQS